MSGSGSALAVVANDQVIWCHGKELVDVKVGKRPPELHVFPQSRMSHRFTIGEQKGIRETNGFGLVKR